MIMLPSRSEPCGLIQHGLPTGTLPLVRRAGGWPTPWPTLRTGRSTGEATGFVFDNASVDELLWACRQALALWREPSAGARSSGPRWRRTSPGASARRYLDMYRSFMRMTEGWVEYNPVPSTGRSVQFHRSCVGKREYLNILSQAYPQKPRRGAGNPAPGLRL